MQFYYYFTFILFRFCFLWQWSVSTSSNSEYEWLPSWNEKTQSSTKKVKRCCQTILKSSINHSTNLKTHPSIFLYNYQANEFTSQIARKTTIVRLLKLNFLLFFYWTFVLNLQIEINNGIIMKSVIFEPKKLILIHLNVTLNILLSYYSPSHLLS